MRREGKEKNNNKNNNKNQYSTGFSVFLLCIPVPFAFFCFSRFRLSFSVVAYPFSFFAVSSSLLAVSSSLSLRSLRLSGFGLVYLGPKTPPPPDSYFLFPIS
jgi:hypothetical protein